MTLIVLVLFVKSSKAPAALGNPYKKKVKDKKMIVFKLSFFFIKIYMIINFIKIINITFEIKMYIKLYFVMIYK